MKKVFRLVLGHKTNPSLRFFSQVATPGFFESNTPEKIDKTFGFDECIKFASAFWFLKGAQKMPLAEIMQNTQALVQVLEKAFSSIRFDLKPSEAMSLFTYYSYMAALRQSSTVEFDISHALQKLAFRADIYKLVSFVATINDFFFFSEEGTKKDLWPVAKHVLAILASDSPLSTNEIITFSAFLLKFTLQSPGDINTLHQKLDELRRRTEFKSFYTTASQSEIFHFFLIYLYSLRADASLVNETTIARYIPFILEQLSEAQYCEVMNQVVQYSGVNASLFAAVKGELMSRLDSFPFNNIVEAVKFLKGKYEIEPGSVKLINAKLSQIVVNASKYDAYNYLSLAVRFKETNDESLARKIWGLWGPDMAECKPISNGNDKIGVFSSPLLLLQSLRDNFEVESALFKTAVRNIHATVVEKLDERAPLEVADSSELRLLCSEIWGYCNDAKLIKKIVESEEDSLKRWIEQNPKTVYSMLGIAALSPDLHVLVGEMLGCILPEQEATKILDAVKSFPELSTSNRFISAFRSKHQKVTLG